MHLDVARADRLLTRLGDLLRASLQPAGQTLVPLREELRLLELYAQDHAGTIRGSRHSGLADRRRHTERWRACNADAAIPGKRAFKHAVERGREKVHMEVTAVREEERSWYSRSAIPALRCPPIFAKASVSRTAANDCTSSMGIARPHDLSEQADGVHATITVPCRTRSGSVSAQNDSRTHRRRRMGCPREARTVARRARRLQCDRTGRGRHPRRGALPQHAPDVAFLDIQMPGLTGLDVAAQLEQTAAPLLVFVTAFDAHAIRAFELNAIDYVLKPFDKDRLVRHAGACTRAHARPGCPRHCGGHRSARRDPFEGATSGAAR